MGKKINWSKLSEKQVEQFIEHPSKKREFAIERKKRTQQYETRREDPRTDDSNREDSKREDSKREDSNQMENVKP